MTDSKKLFRRCVCQQSGTECDTDVEIITRVNEITVLKQVKSVHEHECTSHTERQFSDDGSESDSDAGSHSGSDAHDDDDCIWNPKERRVNEETGEINVDIIKYPAYRDGFINHKDVTVKESAKDTDSVNIKSAHAKTDYCDFGFAKPKDSTKPKAQNSAKPKQDQNNAKHKEQTHSNEQAKHKQHGKAKEHAKTKGFVNSTESVTYTERTSFKEETTFKELTSFKELTTLHRKPSYRDRARGKTGSPVPHGPVCGSVQGSVYDSVHHGMVYHAPVHGPVHGPVYVPVKRHSKGLVDLPPESTPCSLENLDVVPILEINDNRDVIYSGEGDKLKMYQPYKGQLKVSVYINYGLLTVHVIQARHLSAKAKETCDSYVKLSLVPDSSKRTKCNTEPVLDTNHPVYDEKFSFELLEEDMRKRLLISVWHRDVRRGRKDFLGCMSFGLQHIAAQRRTVNGWYYLLTEDIGKKKHLQVSAKRQHLTEITSKTIPPVNQDVLWMEPHVLVIRRSPLGYGFSLTGASPVRICRVEAGGPGSKNGLQVDDCIVRINGINVSRSTAESIARIIRHSPQHIILEVQRPRQMVTQEVPVRKPLTSTLRGPTVNTAGSGAHSDSELEIETKTKQSSLGLAGFCGTLPRKRVTFKDPNPVL